MVRLAMTVVAASAVLLGTGLRFATSGEPGVTAGADDPPARKGPSPKMKALIRAKMKKAFAEASKRADAPARKVQASPRDLDDLLGVLGGEGYLGQARVGEVELDDWVRTVDRLRNSSDATLSGAAKAAGSAGVHRYWQAKLLAEADQFKSDLLNGRDVGLATAFMGMIDSIGESNSALQSQVDRNIISPETARAIREARAERDVRAAEAATPFLQKLANSYLAKQQARNLDHTIAALQADVIQTQLLAPIKARAGASTDGPSFAVKYGVGGSRDAWPEGYLTAASLSDRELTRVTLLVELKNGVVLAYYFPKLEPKAGFRARPIVLTNGAIRSDAKVDRSRFSVWCDQFSAEGKDVETLAQDQAQIEYFRMGLPVGALFWAKTETARVKERYALEVTKVEPAKGSFRVHARLTRQTVDDPPKVLDQAVYAGTCSAGPKTAPAEGRFALKARNDEFQSYLRVDPKGELVWVPRTRQTRGASLYPEPDVRSAEARRTAGRAEFASKMAPIQEARQLAQDGQKAKAEQILKAYLANSPGPDWTARAQTALDQLDQLERIGQMKAKAKANPQRRPGSGFGPRR